MAALIFDNVEILAAIADDMARTPLDEQLAPLRDPGNDVELAHVLYERAQRIDIDGPIVEDLIGLGIDHMRAVEGDKQAVVGLELELRGDGAQALDGAT